MAESQSFSLVTGCGQGGIGEALVKTYKSSGVYPIATILPSESSDHLDAEGIEWFPLDVTKEESVVELKKRVEALTGGRLDVLVNNAGICYTMPAVDTDVQEAKVMFDVNVFGPMRMVHHFHDLLVEAKGAIVNISSVGGVTPYCFGSSYNASKAALQHWSSTLRLEMLPFDVKVITVISGEISTNILKRDQSCNRELPTGSIFSPIRDTFNKHINRVPNTTNRFEYAKGVVAESLRRSPHAWFWHCKPAVFVWFLDTFLFRTIWDYVFWKDFKFDTLTDAHRQKVKSD